MGSLTSTLVSTNWLDTSLSAMAETISRSGVHQARPSGPTQQQRNMTTPRNSSTMTMTACSTLSPPKRMAPAMMSRWSYAFGATPAKVGQRSAIKPRAAFQPKWVRSGSGYLEGACLQPETSMAMVIPISFSASRAAAFALPATTGAIGTARCVFNSPAK